MKCWVFFAIAYLTVGFLTFGWIQNQPLSESEQKYGRSDPGRDIGSLFGIVAWPAYWSATGSVKLVQYAKAQTPVAICKDAAGNAWKPTAEGVCLLPAR